MSPQFVTLAYLLASILFILGLKGLTHPRTAVRGNLMGCHGHADRSGRNPVAGQFKFSIDP